MIYPQQIAARGLDFLRHMAQRPLAFFGFLIVCGYLLVMLTAPMIAPYGFADVLDDPNNCITRNDQTRCAALKNAPPSADYLMGTDRNGRDVFSRILYGTRETIGLPMAATILSVLLGTILGLAIGYYGGWIDEVVSRILDSLLAIPALIMALVTLATIVPALEMSENPLIQAIGAVNIALIFVITLLYTPIVARVIRSATLNLRDRGYVEIARLRGESTAYILFSEILPGVLPALIVEGSLRFSYAIFLVASLGFLGLGAQPPSPEWGRMVLDARSQYATAPWALWYPVLAIAILIISVNLMSDGLQRIFRHEAERE
jgi:peptide/nickel transport system permease protein